MTQNLPQKIERCAEFKPIGEIIKLQHKLRGIYVLYHHPQDSNRKEFNVVYIGMTRAGIRGRLVRHSQKKAGWTHFSLFKVWDKIRDEEITELEGLFRHIYRRDSKANSLNK